MQPFTSNTWGREHHSPRNQCRLQPARGHMRLLCIAVLSTLGATIDNCLCRDHNFILSLYDVVWMPRFMRPISCVYEILYRMKSAWPHTQRTKNLDSFPRSGCTYAILPILYTIYTVYTVNWGRRKEMADNVAGSWAEKRCTGTFSSEYTVVSHGFSTSVVPQHHRV